VADGSDLQVGAEHYVPVAKDARLSACLAGCDASAQSACTIVPGGGYMRLPPLPLIANGVPICLRTSLRTASGTADIASGTVAADVALSFDAVVTDPAAICPRCIEADASGVGRCDSGPYAGGYCTVEQVETIHTDSGDLVYPVSTFCAPAGEEYFFDGATRLTTGAAVEPAPCLADPAHCAGMAVTPTPPWPDPTYPKTAAAARLVAMTCVPPITRTDGSTIQLPCPLAFSFGVAETWSK